MIDWTSAPAALCAAALLVCGGCAVTAQSDPEDLETANVMADENSMVDGNSMIDETSVADETSMADGNSMLADDAASDTPAAGGPLECGGASFYADKFVGRSTASGEPYAHEALTAAHKTLPFGTELIVRRESDGAEVMVRVNDRGPFVEGRVIDLSKSAAETLGIVRAGVAEVCLFETASASSG